MVGVTGYSRREEFEVRASPPLCRGSRRHVSTRVKELLYFLLLDCKDTLRFSTLLFREQKCEDEEGRRCCRGVEP